MKIKKCPKCGSYNIVMDIGGITGTWKCKACGYVGSFFLEKEIDEEELKKQQKGGKS